MIYNTDYYGGAVQGANFPWCCVFIWWLFWKSDLSALFCGGQKTAYCPFVVQYAREHGQWVTGDYKPGDLLLYDWDGDGQADHIGLCELETDAAEYVWAIEGNCGDAVLRTHRWTANVMGAYRPSYGEELSAPADPSAPAESGADTYTVQPGDMLGLIAARFGTTISELARINGIRDVNQIWPGQVLQLRDTTSAAADQSDGEPENEITAMARDVIAGKYGNGLIRRIRLGKNYAAVQAEVNRLLRNNIDQ